MPAYLITNRVPDSFKPGPEAFAAWTAWFEHLGSHLEDRGNPALTCTALGNCGPGTSARGGTVLRGGRVGKTAVTRYTRLR
jgi:hypothetical protein